jgi:hypothetical protein
MTALSYVLPVRARPGDVDEDHLDAYLAWLSARADVVVVDGSEPSTFAEHAQRWERIARHVAPAPELRCANGKVWGVRTGVWLARHDRVVIADDDVRYDAEALRRIGALLDTAEVVRPQNRFEPLPWHARWDTARILLNRALGHDHPGTLGIRRSFFLSIGGYDGNVLFENLELVRTVQAAGGRVVDAPWLFVVRRPPTVRRFLEQRPRQAYDDWAQPAKLAAMLAVLPAAGVAARSRPRAIAAAAGLAVATAEVGRIRHDGRRAFDAVSPLFAPLWLLERAAMAWVALAWRVLRGGCPYAGSVILRAATPPRMLRRRFRSPLEG